MQLVPKVSVVTRQLSEHLSDETVSQVDSPSSSILVGTLEVSVSIAKVTASNSATVCKLNNLLLMHVHQHRTDKLDLVTLARELISVNSRRINYFGKTM